MKEFMISRKRIVFVSLIIILIVITGLYATYAINVYVDEGTPSTYDMALNFDLSSNVSREVTVAAGKTKVFDIDIENTYTDAVQYGVAYTLVSPTTLPDNVTIARTDISKDPSQGTVNASSTITTSIIVVNESTSSITLSFSVINGYKNGGNLIVPSDKTLITDIYYVTPPDFSIKSILINDSSVTNLSAGLYTMSSNCSNASYDRLKRKIDITNFSGQQECNFSFTTDTNYPLLNTMKVGDYVAYVGNNGCNNGVAGTTGTGNAEAGNSCLGENANQSEDTSGYTYGYCYGSGYKYYVYGWRIAYIENNKVYLTSAGSPECRTRTSSTGNATQIADLNTAALDYCNATYADGGTCSSSNTWAMGNTDFKKITNAISGTSSNLTTAYGSPYCYGTYSTQRCGYNNDLIDNGGYYWFAAYYSTSSTNSVIWRSNYRYVDNYSDTGAYGFRPIIGLSSSVFVTGGSGTMSDPYTIGI